MKRGECTIVNRLGLHARAAAQFVQLANQYHADILLKKEDVEVNGKSIMGILMLAAPKGSIVELVVDGPDEENAFIAMEELIKNGFGEE